MNIRALFAIVLCKLLRLVSRLLRRGGTAMPGRWALKICPDLLAILGANVKTVAVTGTNGKTTSARMIEEGFARGGESYFSNRSGANLISGITTEFVMNCTLGGRMKKEYAVIECDEAAAVRVFAQLQPKVIVVTNLFRDQLDRFGEVTYTLESVRTAISGAPNAVLCLNADDSLTASLALTLPNAVAWFGLEKDAVPSRKAGELSDATHCTRCRHEYDYDYITYAHLGGFRCPQCGYARHSALYAVTDVPDMAADSSTVVMSLKGEKRVVNVNLPAIYNIYNAVGAAAAIMEMGLSADVAVEALSSFQCGFGRMESIPLGHAGARMMLVKNPAGCNQVIEYLQKVNEKFTLVICLNDRTGDGTDVSWIWDTDFEALAQLPGQLEKLIVSGDRAEEMRLRMKYAGIPDSNIQMEKDYGKLVEQLSGEERRIFLMPTYTAMLDLRQVIVKHCGGSNFWEA